MEWQGPERESTIDGGADPSRRGTRHSPFSIAVIATYFGNWPPWFPAFLVSCSRNESVNWILFTDCPELSWRPPNVRTIPMSMDQLNELAGEKTGLKVCKRLYSQCDLRPTYGVIFEEYLREFDFWGHCDLDVVWGDLRRFITDSILDGSDLISGKQGLIGGHLSLWRNDERINHLFEDIPGWNEILKSPDYFRLDEDRLTDHLRSSRRPRIYWNDQMVADYYHLEEQPVGWRWVEGRLWNPSGQEAAYLHFMTWKRYLKQIDFELGETPREFLVNRRGIWAGQLPVKEIALGCLQYDKWFSRTISLKRSLEKLTWSAIGEGARQIYEKKKR